MSNSVNISFVLPMYNECENIAHTIDAIHELTAKICDDYEIVVVDDASSDESVEIVNKIAADDSRVKLFRLEENTRFGGAFAKGFKSSTKDIILYMDSDMPVGVDDIVESFKLIEDSDIVTGYSKIKKGDTVFRKFVSGTYNLMVQILFGLSVRDINSGYKIVRKKVVDELQFISKSPFVDVELFLHAKKKGFRVKQYPLVFLSRFAGQSHIASLPFMLATFRDMLKVKIHSYKR